MGLDLSLILFLVFSMTGKSRNLICLFLRENLCCSIVMGFQKVHEEK